MDIEKLNSIAKTYVGTPHINGGNVKGAGLDCCTLPAHIFKDLLGIETKITFGYPADWFCRRDCKEILLPYLQSYCHLSDDLRAGDIISFRWGRAKYAHLAVYLGNGRCVHCSADNGTEMTDLQNSYFFDGKGHSRITGYWRVNE